MPYLISRSSKVYADLIKDVMLKMYTCFYDYLCCIIMFGYTGTGQYISAANEGLLIYIVI